jgi:hypothetical protein
MSASAAAIATLAVLISSWVGEGALHEPRSLLANLLLAQTVCGQEPPPVNDPCFTGWQCNTIDLSWEEKWAPQGTACSTGTACDETCGPTGCGGGFTCAPRAPCEAAQCNPNGTCTYSPLPAQTCPTSTGNPCEAVCDGASAYCQPLCDGDGTCPLGTSCCSGLCRNLTNDPNNCSACGIACVQGLACCSTQCLDLNSNVNNCGACGRACPGTANGYPTCSGGTCGLACISTYTLCGSACKKLSSDFYNCGACNRVCSSGQSCSNGTCVWPPPPENGCGSLRDCCGDGSICRSSCSGVYCR